MKELTWQAVVVFLAVVAAIVILFVNTSDEATRAALVGFLEILVGFVVGGGIAATAGWHRGYAKGKGLL